MRSSAGFSLMELIISVGISGLVIGILASIWRHNFIESQRLQALTQMRDLATMIEGVLRDPRSLGFSSNQVQNLEMLACVRSDGDACNVSGNRAFFLYRNSNVGNLADLAVAGPGVFYSRRGERCNGPACEFQPAVSFTASCAATDRNLRQVVASGGSYSGISSCDQARSLHFRFQIIHNPSESWRGRALPSLPLGDNVVYSFSSKLINTQREYAPSCPANEVMLAVNDGVPVCECRVPYGLDDDGACEISGEAVCPVGQHFLGVDLVGDPRCLGFACSWVSASLSSLTCDDGEWLSGVRVVGNPNCRCDVPAGSGSFINEGQVGLPGGGYVTGASWRYGCDLQCDFAIKCCKPNIL